MHYLPLTPQDEKAILARIGVATFQELLDKMIPGEIQHRGAIGLPAAMSETEIHSLLKKITGQNSHTDDFVSFLGAGVYDHYLPAIVDNLISRSEFYTAYTPYQAEVSQGTLQSIFEYQSVICELTGMDISNASMYDLGSALAEACHMANAIKGKNRLIISDLVHPYYQKVAQTYTRECCIEIVRCPSRNGVLDREALKELLKEEASCVAIQQPNFYGYLEATGEIEKVVHQHDTLLIAAVDPLSLGVVAPPGEYNADICVGEGQGMGIAQGFGGPLLGFFSARMEFARYLPGRIVGETVDREGKRGFVLTLQTREQHIRREKATSNICTNEALCALSSLIYLCALGKQGIVELGNLILAKSHYLRDRLSRLPGLKFFSNREFFKEFVVETEKPAVEIVDRMLDQKIFAGVPLSIFDPKMANRLLVAVTEKRTKEEIDRYVDGLAKAL
jgi:glycine dehydrogenase subunit 1